MELGSIGDVELGEHPAEVIADGPVADKQALADLPVRQAIGGQARDLRLPHGQIAPQAPVARSFSQGLAAGGKLPPPPTRESPCPHRPNPPPGHAPPPPPTHPA